MMGRTHAAAGLLAAAATFPVAGHVDADPVVWTAAWVAGSMLPDLDSGGSHIARVWGWPTRWLGTTVGKLAGGHRETTHDVVIAPLAVAALGTVALWWPPAAILLAALMVGIGLRMAATHTWRPLALPVVNLVVSITLGWAVIVYGGPLWWAPLVVAAGMVLHICCDAVTPEGAPLPVAWIWNPRARSIQWGLPILRTGSTLEAVLAPVFVTIAVFLTGKEFL